MGGILPRVVGGGAPPPRSSEPNEGGFGKVFISHTPRVGGTPSVVGGGYTPGVVSQMGGGDKIPLPTKFAKSYQNLLLHGG